MPFAKTAALLALLPSVLLAQTRLPQREQTEQIRTPKLSLDQSWQKARIGEIGPSESMGTDDAFGAQVILKERPDRRFLQASLDAAFFYTDNVALSRDERQGDSFLNTTLALGWRRPLTDRLTASIAGRYGLFRYNRFSALDFQSLDVEASLAVKLPAGLDFFTGYGFTQFTSRQGIEEFYSEHSVNAALQRIFPLSRAHHFVAGVSAQWSWAEPESAQRDRYSAYLGYHVQATEHLTGDVVYRYSFYDYRDAGEGRGDSNHSVSLSLRYDLADWLAVTATALGTWNRSNQSVFDYDAFTVGGSVGLNARF